MSFISVAAGGAIGASIRFGVSLMLSPAGRFPLATLSVNVIGCFIAGVLGTWVMARASVSPQIQLFLITGILGGFTTFSAFSLETLGLAESGQWAWAIVNVLANMIGALLAVASGWWLARAFLI